MALLQIKLQDLEDKVLIEQCKNKSRKAQKELYDRYYLDIMKFAILLLKDQETANEVVNDTFCKAFMNLDKFEYKSSLKTWLMSIAKNTALTMIFKHNKLKLFEITVHEFKNDSISVENDFIKKCDFEDTLHYLSQLSAMERVVFTLKLIEQLSIAEISDEIGITESTCRWHLMNAKNKMKSIIVKEQLIK